MWRYLSRAIKPRPLGRECSTSPRLRRTILRNFSEEEWKQVQAPAILKELQEVSQGSGYRKSRALARGTSFTISFLLIMCIIALSPCSFATVNDSDFEGFEQEEVLRFYLVGFPSGTPEGAHIERSFRHGEYKHGQYGLAFRYERGQQPAPLLFDSALLTDFQTITFWIKSKSEAIWVVSVKDTDGAVFTARRKLPAGKWIMILLKPDDFTFKTDLHRIRLHNTTVTTWNLYATLAAELEIRDCIFGESISFNKSTIRIYDSHCDGTGGYVGARDESTTLFSQGTINAAVITHGRAQFIIERSRIDGPITAAEASVITLKDTILNGKVNRIGNGQVMQE